MNLASVILARGGSKGIPNKNIIDLNGQPLLSYTINAAKPLSEVWVSTENKQIANTAKFWGAKVLIRPDELATDTSSSEEALLHFHNNIPYDVMIFLQPTSPLVTTEDLEASVNKLINNNLDSVFSVARKHWIPTWDLNIQPINWDLNYRPRRQEMPEYYEENGAFYITTRKQFEKSHNRCGGKIGVFEMPISRSFQIDTFEDLELIKKLI